MGVARVICAGAVLVTSLFCLMLRTLSVFTGHSNDSVGGLVRCMYLHVCVSLDMTKPLLDTACTCGHEFLKLSRM